MPKAHLVMLAQTVDLQMPVMLKQTHLQQTELGQGRVLAQ